MEYYEKLQKAILAEDEIETEDILYKIEEEDYSIDYVEAILRLMEENPDIDYGMPGPTVHFVESFFMRGYETLLLESIQRIPTLHTLWMLNRIVNSPKLADRKKYIEALKSITERNDISEEIRQEANDFLRFQAGR